MIEYPQKFIDDRNDKTKKVFLIEPPKGHLYDCENCGGLGNLSAFYANKGPHIHTPPCPLGEVLKSVSDSHYGWMWYTGKTFIMPCSVCDGLGMINGKPKKPMRKEDYEQLPKLMIKKLSKKMRVPAARETPKIEPWQKRKDIA